MQQHTINGLELAYEVRGSGEPVLLIHGGIIADIMAPMMAEPVLADDYRLIRYHRRGYGASSRSGHPSGLSDQVGDAVAILRHAGAGQAHIVGYSFGGAIALQLAIDVPQMVASITLLDTIVPAGITEARVLQFFLETIGQPYERFGSGDRVSAVDTWARGAFGPNYRVRLEAALPGAWLQAVNDAPALFLIDGPALQSWHFGPDDAARIQIPTLVVSHTDPYWAGFAQAHQALLGWLPAAEQAVLPVDTHLLPVVAAREVARTIARFLARHRFTTPVS
jgi:3-oxoadipate enol-lactonase